MCLAQQNNTMDSSLHELMNVALGTSDAEKMFRFLKDAFYFDALISDQTGEQEAMAAYTAGTTMRRRAMMVVNMQGGGLFEILQPLDTPAIPLPRPLQFGDLGINTVKIGSYNINKSYGRLLKMGHAVSALVSDPFGRKTFFLRDFDDNLYQVLEAFPGQEHRFLDLGRDTSGIVGCVIGVSNIEEATRFYCDNLGYEFVDGLEQGDNHWNDNFCGHSGVFKQALLRKPSATRSLLATLLGPSEIELVCTAFGPDKIRLLDGRRWGDAGFCHFALDSIDMDNTRRFFAARKCAITVDTRINWDGIDVEFLYLEDPDKTLVEVTYFRCIPLLRSIGLYYDISKKGVKPLGRFWFYIIRLLHRQTT